MNFSRLAQIAGRSIGIAIALCFSIHYALKGLLCLSKNNSQIIAVVCLSLSIATITLIKEKMTPSTQK